jgi:hypothetical protein
MGGFFYSLTTDASRRLLHLSCQNETDVKTDRLVFRSSLSSFSPQIPQRFGLRIALILSMKKNTLVILQVAVLSLFAWWSPCQAGEWTRTGPTTISFTGTIEIDELSRFKDIYKPTDETIFLNSTGGRMDAALDIGKVLVENKKLTAVVQGLCASSCANYLFLAAKNKNIDHGIVGFHGNWKAMVKRKAFRDRVACLVPDERAKVLAFHLPRVKEETEFLAKTGASQELFDRTQRENDNGVYDIYAPGRKQFEKYGIHNVVGAQNITLIKGNAILFEDGPDDNNAADLKLMLAQEWVNATEKRKVEIRAALKTLNKQYPPRENLDLGMTASGLR